MDPIEEKVVVEVLLGWTEEQVVRVEVERTVTARALAREAEGRAAWLRSRPMSKGFEKREREMLADLDALAARARVAALAEERELVTKAQAHDELSQLEQLAFACFRRFQSLAADVDAPFPTRAKAQDPQARQRELAEIARFLAERK